MVTILAMLGTGYEMDEMDEMDGDDSAAEDAPETDGDDSAAEGEPEKTRTVRVDIDHAEFVEFWQKSASTREVAEHYGIKMQSASGRASYLRKNGVPLKKRGGGFKSEPTDFKALAKLVKQIAKDAEAAK